MTVSEGGRGGVRSAAAKRCPSLGLRNLDLIHGTDTREPWKDSEQESHWGGLCVWKILWVEAGRADVHVLVSGWGTRTLDLCHLRVFAHAVPPS